MSKSKIGLCLSLFILPTFFTYAQAPQTAPKGVKLAVLVVFDQFRGDYVEKWQELFGEGGIKRLQTDGTWFTNCHYPFSDTLTAVGHASLSTGASPWKNGIVGNDWFDRSISKNAGAAHGDPRSRVVPGTGGNDGPSPFRLRAETVGDSLLKASMGKSKVASISIKDTAAVLMAALRAQMCYWLSGTRFVTSTYYRDKLHPWVDEFNKAKVPESLVPAAWTTLRADLDYAKFAGPDDVSFEGTGFGQGRTFPHPFVRPTVDNKALEYSPYGNELLLAFVKKAIDAEKLGQGEAPDLLCVSFSCNDLIGHTWGPDSQESLDITLRTDVIVKDLLETLDAKVGKDNYIFVLSADHGVCPIPELAKQQGKDAGRIVSFSKTASKYLQSVYAPDKKDVRWFEAENGHWFYLNRAILKDLKLESADVEKSLADWLVKQGGVQTAFTRTQLQRKLKEGETIDPVEDLVRHTFYPERSGDVIFVPKANYLYGGGSNTFRTTHGSPQEYDTHVPLLVYGPGVKAGKRNDPVTPLAAAPILARALKIPPPSSAEVPVPDGLFDPRH